MIPSWYGGGTPASCRRAADYCDGWMPGRIPTATFNKMVKYLEEQCKLAGRPMVTTGAIPITETILRRVRSARLVPQDPEALPPDP